MRRCACASAGPIVATIFVRQLDTVVVDATVCHGKHRVEHIAPEFLANALVEHLLGVRTTHAVFDDVVQNAGDDSAFVAAVARENDRDVRRVGQIGQTRALSDLAVVMLRREREFGDSEFDEFDGSV